MTSCGLHCLSTDPKPNCNHILSYEVVSTSTYESAVRDNAKFSPSQSRDLTGQLNPLGSILATHTVNLQCRECPYKMHLALVHSPAKEENEMDGQIMAISLFLGQVSLWIPGSVRNLMSLSQRERFLLLCGKYSLAVKVHPGTMSTH